MSQPPNQVFQHKTSDSSQSTPITNIFTNQSIKTSNIFNQKNVSPQVNQPVNVFSQNNSGGSQQSGQADYSGVKNVEDKKNLMAQQWVENMKKEESISGKTEVKTAEAEIKTEGSKLAKKTTKDPIRERQEQNDAVTQYHDSHGAKPAPVTENLISFGANHSAFKTTQPVQIQSSGGNRSEGNTQTQQTQNQNIPVIDPTSNTLVQGSQPNVMSQGTNPLLQKDPFKGNNPSSQNVVNQNSTGTTGTAPQNTNIFNQANQANQNNNQTNIFNTQQQQQSQNPNGPVPPATNPSQDPNFVPIMKGEDYLAKQKLLFPEAAQLSQE
jgi:hypothetical protein